MSNDNFYKHIAKSLQAEYNHHWFDKVCPKYDSHDIAGPVISHQEFEEILVQLDAGNSHE